MKKIIAYEILIIVAVLGPFFVLVKLGSESFIISIADNLSAITIAVFFGLLLSFLAFLEEEDFAFTVVGIVLIAVSVVIALNAGAVILGASITVGKVNGTVSTFTGNSLAIFLAILTAITATLGSALIFSQKWTKDFKSVLIGSLALGFLIILIPILITVY